MSLTSRCERSRCAEGQSGADAHEGASAELTDFVSCVATEDDPNNSEADAPEHEGGRGSRSPIAGRKGAVTGHGGLRGRCACRRLPGRCTA